MLPKRLGAKPIFSYQIETERTILAIPCPLNALRGDEKITRRSIDSLGLSLKIRDDQVWGKLNTRLTTNKELAGSAHELQPPT